VDPKKPNRTRGQIKDEISKKKKKKKNHHGKNSEGKMNPHPPRKPSENQKIVPKSAKEHVKAHGMLKSSRKTRQGHGTISTGRQEGEAV